MSTCQKKVAVNYGYIWMHRALDGFPNVKSFCSFVRSEETVHQPESKPKPKIDPEKYFNDMNSFDIWQSFVSSFFLVP